MWWALFILLAAMAPTGDKGIILQQLEMGLIAAGVMLVIVSFLPIMERIRDLFTPLVTGVYLVLLVLQLCGAFFKGMLGVTMTGHVDFRVAGVSLSVIVLVLLVSGRGKGLFRSMGPLIGIATGWALFALLGMTEPRIPGDETAGWFVLPELFAWGAPIWDFGVVLTSLLTGAILISNVVASILVISRTLDREADASTYRLGLRGNGVNTILSGGLSVVGLVPLSVSAGFIMTTGIRARLPFIIGAVLIAISGLLPFVGQFFAMLPAEVAYAATFIPFAQMLSFGVRDLMGVEPSNRNLLIIGMTMMVGVGVMFLPPDALSSLAPWARNLFANGLLVGLILCLLLEHVIFKEKGHREGVLFCAYRVDLQKSQQVDTNANREGQDDRQCKRSHDNPLVIDAWQKQNVAGVDHLADDQEGQHATARSQGSQGTSDERVCFRTKREQNRQHHHQDNGQNWVAADEVHDRNWHEHLQQRTYRSRDDDKDCYFKEFDDCMANYVVEHLTERFFLFHRNHFSRRRCFQHGQFENVVLDADFFFLAVLLNQQHPADEYGDGEGSRDTRPHHLGVQTERHVGGDHRQRVNDRSGQRKRHRRRHRYTFAHKAAGYWDVPQSQTGRAMPSRAAVTTFKAPFFGSIFNICSREINS